MLQRVYAFTLACLPYIHIRFVLLCNSHRSGGGAERTYQADFCLQVSEEKIVTVDGTGRIGLWALRVGPLSLDCPYDIIHRMVEEEEFLKPDALPTPARSNKPGKKKKRRKGEE